MVGAISLEGNKVGMKEEMEERDIEEMGLGLPHEGQTWRFGKSRLWPQVLQSEYGLERQSRRKQWGADGAL